MPEVVVQDGLRTSVLVTVGRSTRLQENFYAITTLHRHRIERLEQLLAGAPAFGHGNADAALTQIAPASPVRRAAVRGSQKIGLCGDFGGE